MQHLNILSSHIEMFRIDVQMFSNVLASNTFMVLNKLPLDEKTATMNCTAIIYVFSAAVGKLWAF